MNALATRGVHFAVCQMATEAIAAQIAAGTGADAGNIAKELGANLVSNGHLVPAGIVAVNRVQERGYSIV
jgi:intracellular sulfur oxidation DsrE/DsrF family protein